MKSVILSDDLMAPQFPSVSMGLWLQLRDELIWDIMDYRHNNFQMDAISDEWPYRI